MIKDPDTVWDGGFPYDTLAAEGITPDSTHQEVIDLPFRLMRHGRYSLPVQLAHDELRQLSRRLVLDLLMYPGAEVTSPASAVVDILRGLTASGVEVDAQRWIDVAAGLVEFDR